LVLIDVALLLVGTLVGGVLGTKALQRLQPSVVRAIIVALGIGTTLRLAW